MKGVFFFCYVIILCLVPKGNADNGWVSVVQRFDVSKMVWHKLVSVCMRRDVIIIYQFQYNRDAPCCPKLLLYSDEQYQRIIFLQALQILLEEEIGKRTGRRERERFTDPSENLNSWSPEKVPGSKRKRREVISQYNTTTCPLNLSKIFLNLYFNKKEGMETMEEDHLDIFDAVAMKINSIIANSGKQLPKESRRLFKRDITINETNITYHDVIQQLYGSDSSLIREAKLRIRATETCEDAQNNLIQVLDPTQIIDLCPQAGVSVVGQSSGFQSCKGVIRPVNQVFLPDLTETQSWFGRAEKSTGNKNFDAWAKNTWHLALLNCPGGDRLQVAYTIDFDIYQNMHKKTTDVDYIQPNLQKECSKTVLPRYSSQDGIKPGGVDNLQSSTRLITFLAIFLNLLNSKVMFL